jgi:hypothetical protein
MSTGQISATANVFVFIQMVLSGQNVLTKKIEKMAVLNNGTGTVN